MVEIISINVRRSSICWRGRRELDNGRRNRRNHGYDVIVGGELFLWITRSLLATVTLKPVKLKSNSMPDATSFFPVADAYRKQLGLKDFSPKSQTLWHCSRLRSVRFTYDWSWWYPSGNDRCSNISSRTGRWLVQSVYKADSLIAKIQRSGWNVMRLMYEQSYRDYLRPGYLHHRLPVMGC